MKFLPLFLLLTVAGSAQQKKLYNLVVGTYTNSGKSEGIYVYQFDPKDGSAVLKNKATGITNPSFLTISPSGKFVYSTNEASGVKGAVTAFAFDGTTGALSQLNAQQTGGDGPCHISVTSDNTLAFAANYGGGSLSAVRINKNGALDSNVQVIQNSGSSVNRSRQDKPHVHAAVLSPDEKYLLSPDLGTDRINVYNVNRQTGKDILTPAPTPFVAIKGGSGPRHLAYHPNGKFLYLVQEMDGAVSFYAYANGKLNLKQYISLVAKGDTGRIGAADIHVSPDGQFLYASNRGDANKIAIFKLDKSGNMKLVGHQSTLGNTPRNFAIDPTGKFLLVGNQGSDNIVVFARNKKTGLLTPTGLKIEVGSPSCLKFVAVP